MLVVDFPKEFQHLTNKPTTSILHPAFTPYFAAKFLFHAKDTAWFLAYTKNSNASAANELIAE